MSEEAPAYEESIGHFTFLDDPISLDEIRTREAEIRQIRTELDASLSGKPAYFPFQIPANRPISPAQGAYLTKMPRSVLDLFPELLSALEIRSDLTNRSSAPISTTKKLSVTNRSGRGSSSGRQTDVKKKLAAENHAMKLATEYLEAIDYFVEDVSNKPSLGYDLRATREAEVVGCEAKGSTNLRVGVDLQASEVDFAREVLPPYRSLLYVVDDIDLTKIEDDYICHGGRERPFWDLNLDPDSLTPTAYRYMLPTTK